MPQDIEIYCWTDNIDQETLSAPDLFCIEISTVKGYDARLHT